MTTAATWREYLKKIYCNPKNPSSFEGVDKLYKQAKRDGQFKISKSKIKKWLQNQQSYTLHRHVNRNFRRGKVLVEGIDDQFDADLASMADYEKSNDGYKYLLVVIDTFSGYAWIEHLKNKTANSIVRVFNKILSEGRKPRRLRTDAATDFTSKHLTTREEIRFASKTCLAWQNSSIFLLSEKNGGEKWFHDNLSLVNQFLVFLKT